MNRANVGRFIELANEVVHKHRSIFLSSGGNAGPGLTTVGAPGGSADGVMGIGAYVSSGELYSKGDVYFFCRYDVRFVFFEG